MVEGMICQMAQRGQFSGKLDDAQFIQLLESVNQQMPRSTSTVKFDRRRAAIDSDDDDDYGLWKHIYALHPESDYNLKKTKAKK